MNTSKLSATERKLYQQLCDRLIECDDEMREDCKRFLEGEYTMREFGEMVACHIAAAIDCETVIANLKHKKG